MWKYGNYIFNHNPKSSTRTLENIGDDIVTQSGRVVSLPTTFKDTINLVADFYQPSSRLMGGFSNQNLNISGIAYGKTSKLFYLVDIDGNIYIKNVNWKDNGRIDLINKNFGGARGLEEHGNKLYIYFEDGYIVVKNLINNDEAVLENVLESCIDITVKNSIIYLINKYGEIYRYNQDTQENVFEWCLDSVVGLASDGKYFWTYDTLNRKFYQFSIENKEVFNTVEHDDDVKGITFFDKYLAYNTVNNTIFYRPNTVLADIYTLGHEVMKGELVMVDDFGFEKNVSIQSFDFQRVSSQQIRYEVTMSVQVMD